jgi:hypothetical protein
VNLSTRGASLSLGPPGATVNISGRGTRATFGLPGTGISYVTRRKSNADALGVAVVVVAVFAVFGLIFRVLGALLGAASQSDHSQ